MQDFAAMAQQAPVEQEDDMMSPISDEELTQSGMPTGNDENAIKGRIMALLEKFGVFQAASPAQQAKLEKEALKLAKAIIAKDVEAIEASPLNDIFEKIVDEENAQLEPSEEELGQMTAPSGGPVPQQTQAGNASVKDFASMMPTPGGGLPGR